MSIANGVGRQVSRTANVVSRIEINPSLATTFSSGVNPHVFRIAPNTAAKIIDGGSPGSFTARELGEAISANPQASRFYSKLQDNGFDLKIVNKADGNVLPQLNLEFKVDRVILRAEGGSQNDQITKNVYRQRESRDRQTAFDRQNSRFRPV